MQLETEVAPSEIQNALSRIWNSLEKARKMRASLFNLIFYTEKSARSAYIHKLAQAVIDKFPSRIIFITFDKEAKQEVMKTKVAVLPVGREDSDIACDLIEIEVSETARTRIPHLVLPHILPDLPVYLLWAEDPVSEDPIAKELSQFATRLIFDSESTCDLSRFATSLLKRREKEAVDIADLNWARTESFRDVISTTFYSTERLLHLKDAKAIEIVYNARKSAFFCHTKIQPTYIQSWLACQLGWKLQKMEQEKELLRFHYQKEKDSVVVTLTAADEADLPAGMILSLSLQTYSEEHYSLLRQTSNTRQISVVYSTKTFCEMPSHFLFPKGEAGQSLVKEICHKGTSSHYLKVLSSLTHLLK